MAGSGQKNYRAKAYRDLIETYGLENYPLTEEEFNKRMDSDTGFVRETYENLYYDVYEENWSEDLNTFKKKAGSDKVTPVVSGAGSKPSQDQQVVDEQQQKKQNLSLARWIGKTMGGKPITNENSAALTQYLKAQGQSESDIQTYFEEYNKTIAKQTADREAAEKKRLGQSVGITTTSSDTYATQDNLKTPINVQNLEKKEGELAERQQLMSNITSQAYDLFFVKDKYAIKLHPAADPANKGKTVYYDEDQSSIYDKPVKVTYDEAKYGLKDPNDPNAGYIIDEKALNEVVNEYKKKYNLSFYEATQLRQNLVQTWESQGSANRARLAADLEFKQQFGAPIEYISEQRRKQMDAAADKSLQESRKDYETQAEVINGQANDEVNQYQSQWQYTVGELTARYTNAVQYGQLSPEEADKAFQQEYQALVKQQNDKYKGLQTRYMRKLTEAKLAAENKYLTDVEKIYAGNLMTQQEKDFYSKAFKKEFSFQEDIRNKNLEYLFRNKSMPEKVGLALEAGVVDLFSSVGGALGYAGFERANYEITRQMDAKFRAMGPLTVADMNGIFDADWWVANGVRSAPMMVALYPVGAGGAALTNAAARLVTSSVRLQNYTSLIGGGLIAHRGETILEQGSAFNDAIAQGKTVEEASQIAADVGRLNLMTLPLQMVQMMPMFNMMPGYLGNTLSMGMGGTEEVIQGYAQKKAVMNQEGKDYSFGDYVKTQEAAVSFTLGSAFEAAPYIIHGSISDGTTDAELNPQIGTIMNIIESGKFTDASAAIETAFINGGIDDATKVNLDLMVSSFQSAVEQTANVTDNVTRQAANNYIVASEFYKAQASMSSGAVAEALNLRAEAEAQKANAILSGQGEIISVKRNGDSAPTIMTQAMFEKFMSNELMVKGIADGDIKVDIRNSDNSQALLEKSLNDYKQKEKQALEEEFSKNKSEADVVVNYDNAEYIVSYPKGQEPIIYDKDGKRPKLSAFQQMEIIKEADKQYQPSEPAEEDFDQTQEELLTPIDSVPESKKGVFQKIFGNIIQDLKDPGFRQAVVDFFTLGSKSKGESAQQGQVGKDVQIVYSVDEDTNTILAIMESRGEGSITPKSLADVESWFGQGNARIFVLDEMDGEVLEIKSIEMAKRFDLGDMRIVTQGSIDTLADELGFGKEEEVQVGEQAKKQAEEAQAKTQQKAATTKVQSQQSDRVKFADDVYVKFEYTVIEADELIPSHLRSGERNPKHSISVAQPKERTDLGSKLAQEKIATKPNWPEVGAFPTAYTGAPVVNQAYEVIQGNNRGIGLKLHYNLLRKGQDSKYKSDLIANAEKLGFDQDAIVAIEGMKNPILVREINVSDTEAITLGQYDAKDIESGGKQRIDAVVTARKFSDSDKKKLADIVFSEDYASVAEAIKANVANIKSLFKKVINMAQFQSAFTNEGTITKSGSEDIQAVVGQFLFENGPANLPSIFEGLPQRIRAAFQTAQRYIFDVPAEKSIIKDVQSAIQMISDFKNQDSDWKAWSNTVDMFTNMTPLQKYGPVASAIGQKSEEAGTQKEIVSLFKDYANAVKDKPADLYDAEGKPGESMEDALSQVFGVDKKDVVREVKEQKKEVKGKKVDVDEVLAALSEYDRTDLVELRNQIPMDRIKKEVKTFPRAKSAEAIATIYANDKNAGVENDFTAAVDKLIEGAKKQKPPSAPSTASKTTIVDEIKQEIGSLKGEQTNVRTESTRKILNAYRKIFGFPPYTGSMDDATAYTNAFKEASEYHSYDIQRKLNNLADAAGFVIDIAEKIRGKAPAAPAPTAPAPSSTTVFDIKNGLNQEQARQAIINLIDKFGQLGLLNKENVEYYKTRIVRFGVKFGAEFNARDAINQYAKDKNVRLSEEEIGNLAQQIKTAYEVAMGIKPSIAPTPTAPTAPAKRPLTPREQKIMDDIKNLGDDIFGDGKLMMGVDPEKLAKAVTMIAKLTELGIYKLGDMFSRLYETFGKKIMAFVDSIKDAYLMYARSAPEDVLDQMDDFKTVRNYKFEPEAETEVAIDEIAQPAKEETVDQTAKRKFRERIKEAIKSLPRLNIVQLRGIANEEGFDFDGSDINLQEQVEAAVYELSREAVAENENDYKEAFEQIKEIYQNQPTISQRSSSRVENQQYSTPAPYSFLAGMFIGQKAESILEPSAGNGLLTLFFDPKKVVANEIDEVRAENLIDLGFPNVTIQDAFSLEDMPLFDGVMTNPPFGGLDQYLDYYGYKITKLEHAMALNALDNMRPDGKASIIIGGHNDFDENGRFKGADRVFFNLLYSKYNVSAVLNIDGDLYAKQGTRFPTRMILINGKRPEGANPIIPNLNNPDTPYLDNVISNYDDFYDVVNKIAQENEIKNLLQTGLDAGLPSSKSAYGSDKQGATDQGGVAGPSKGSDKGAAAQGDRGQGRSKQDDTGGVGSGTDNGKRKPGSDGRRDNGERGVSDTEVATDESVGTGADDIVRQARGERLIQPSEPSRLPSKLTREELSQEKAPYKPVSTGNAVGSVIPTNIATDVEQSLLKIEQKYGPIDEYVMERLDYDSMDELKKSLSAEQIDAVAMAIDQIENNQGVIIGDMTGVGKGRIAAAVIRYAVKQGYIPVFLTEKANLFSDLYRDMKDIGSVSLRPFIVNNKGERDPNVYDLDDKRPDKKPIYSTPSNETKDRIYKSGMLPSQYDVALATYSQFNRGTSAKHTWLSNLARTGKAVFIMDEAHNASGDGNTSAFFQAILPRAKGAMFLSATFAKRPNNMPLYSIKTALGSTLSDFETLVDSIKKGGVALQEIISSGLAKSGQMIRRERDFTGVKIDYETLDSKSAEHRDASDKITEIIRNIIDFQRRQIAPFVKQLDAVEKGGVVGMTKGTSDAGVNNQPFASRVFNVVNQMLLAIKAESAAEFAIQELKNDKKPVISFMNTMESFLSNEGYKEGDVIQNPDFSLILKRGLESVMKITKKDAMGNSKSELINFNELPIEAQNEYKYLMNKIKKATTGMPLSPLDLIRQRIQDAGYSVGELTGRDLYLRYLPDGSAVVERRKGKENRDVNTVVAKFNDGSLDVLMFNATSGISIHASEKFSDKRTRVMITPQIRLDVNAEIQARGRIDRTGQVQRGEFKYVVSDIPAEKRLMIMFQRKMKSLDANTTGSQKNKTSQTPYDDFLNKYGDQIVYDYVTENMDLYYELLEPFSLGDVSPELAHKVSGRVAFLPVAKQEKFYAEIMERYKDHMEFLESNDANDLEVKVLPLNAKLIDSEVTVVGVGADNPFGTDTLLQKVETDVLVKPMKKAEVDDAMEKILNGNTPEEYKRNEIKSVQDNFDKFISEKRSALESQYDKRIEAKIEKMRDQGMTDEQIQEELNELNASKEASIQNAIDKSESTKTTIARRIEYFTVGEMYALPMSITGISEMGIGKGVFMGFEIKKNPTGLLSLSQIKLKFAAADGRRIVSVPLSQEPFLNSVVSNTYFMSATSTGDMNYNNWDSLVPNKTRETRYVVTGNILQGFDKFQGQLVKFTDDKGNVIDGLLLPRGYKKEGSMVTLPLDKAVQWAIEKNIDYQFEVNDGDVTITYDRDSKTLDIRVPKSTKGGGKYFLDEDLRALVDKNNFYSRGSSMIATISQKNIEEFVKTMFRKFNATTSINSNSYSQKSDNKVNEAKKSFDNAKAKVRKLFKSKPGEKLGFAYDPQQAAQEMYDKHKALVDLAKAAIRLGVVKFEKWIKDNSLRNEAWVRRAWADAENQMQGGAPMFGSPADMFNEGVNRVNDVIQKQKDAVKEKQQTFGKKARNLIVRHAFGERRWDLRKQLLKDGGAQAYADLVLVSGAGAAAKEFIAKESAKIFDGLLPKSKALALNGSNIQSNEDFINAMIQARRTIELEDYYVAKRENLLQQAISDYRAKYNQSPTKNEIDAMKKIVDAENQTPLNPDGTTAAEWRATMDSWQKADPIKFAEIYERSDYFFDAMRVLLAKRLEAKRISQETYDRLVSFDYSRRAFVQHMREDFTGEYTLPEKVAGSAGKDIWALEEGSEDMLINNARYLLELAAATTYNVTANNIALESLYNFAKSTPQANDYVQIWSPYRPAPKGFKRYDFYIYDKRRSVILENDLASMWDQRPALTAPIIQDIIGWGSLTTPLKFMATGPGNPFFFLKNMPRDVIQTLMFTNTYSPFMPLAAAQISADIMSVLNDTAMRKGAYLDAVEQGLLMDFLTQQGDFMHSGVKTATSKARQGWETASAYIGYLNNTSELLVRMAIRKRWIDKLTAKFINDEGRDPNSDEMNIIERRATFEARNYMDFASGPTLTKFADQFIPYANAAAVGVKNAIEYSTENPVKTTLKAAQLGGLVIGLVALALKYYEDDYEKGVSNDMKNRYHIIMLPMQSVNDKGEVVRKYISIPKNQQLAPTYALCEEFMRYKMTGQFDSQRILDAAEYAGLSPKVRNWMASIPAFAAWMAIYGNQEVSIGTGELKTIYKTYTPQPEYTKYDVGQTRQFFVDMGLYFDLGPEQLERGFGKVFTDVDRNLWTNLLLTGYDGLKAGMSDDEKVQMDSAIYNGFVESMKKAAMAPITGVFRETRPNVEENVYETAAKYLEAGGEQRWRESQRIKAEIQNLSAGKQIYITGGNAEINRYKRQAINMQIDGEVKMIRMMGVKNGLRAQYIAERQYELINEQNDTERWNELASQMQMAGLISEEVSKQLALFQAVVLIEKEIQAKKAAGATEEDILKYVQQEKGLDTIPKLPFNINK